MSHYALGTEIGKLGQASCQAGWWHQASWCVVFKDSCSYRSWSNFMFCAWGLLRDVTCMFIGGGTAVFTAREVCETGDRPTKGILCYGPPETGKTLLARAVANQTNACFIRVIGSEVVQKYVGEGARMVHELFQVMWCCSQARPQEAEQTQKAWFCAVHSDFKLMLATCPVAPCLTPQEIPVSIYCVTSQWIFYSCAVLSCSLFTICPWSRWLDLRRPALYSLMKLMQLEVLNLMMDQGVAMKFSILCLKL